MTGRLAGPVWPLLEAYAYAIVVVSYFAVFGAIAIVAARFLLTLGGSDHGSDRY